MIAREEMHLEKGWVLCPKSHVIQDLNSGLTDSKACAFRNKPTLLLLWVPHPPPPPPGTWSDPRGEFWVMQTAWNVIRSRGFELRGSSWWCSLRNIILCPCSPLAVRPVMLRSHKSPGTGTVFTRLWDKVFGTLGLSCLICKEVWTIPKQGCRNEMRWPS